MKEFDFDELDKAVNSLMGGVKKTDGAPAKPTPPAPTADITVTVEPPAPTEDSQVVDEVPATTSDVSTQPLVVKPEPVIETPPSSTPSSSVAAKRGGRFMDVVHPSSDMKTTSATSSQSREGITVQPSDSMASPPVDTTIAFQSDTSSASSPQDTTPDETTASPEPWSSPFLPDAQVEKRPLGGSGSDKNENGLSDAIAAELSRELPEEVQMPKLDDEESPKAESPETATDADQPTTTSESDGQADGDKDIQLSPEPADAPLPAELDNDLVAIESGQVSANAPAEVIDSPDTSDRVPTIASSSLAASALSTGSIAPQYSEQPSTGDASHLPIYDDESIHQPLAHPPKNKKGMLIVALIVLTILLGSGLGAVAYSLGLL